MDDLLNWLFAAAVHFSGLPAIEERPEVEALPYPAMLATLCADLDAGSPHLQAQHQRCLLDHALEPDACASFAPQPERHRQCMGQQGLVAAYIIEARRIVHRDDLDLRNDADNSFIVHEFVHALQDQHQDGRMFDTCGGVLAAERQAYAVQQQYLRARGQMLRVGERLRMVGCEGLR